MWVMCSFVVSVRLTFQFPFDFVTRYFHGDIYFSKTNVINLAIHK
ncbi:hypothetical protein GAGA_2859 [Paraglaciecola agarilytica NO2]|uniref:Uncharacterized protein n=1 Tax=Paraglaciecola agarilytica NO2 TaxID=1125747 RepID=A0ABQ0I8U3_9ALTE|nr:hypothetical protein GAGA_2859 [Paraglaciecola agarilytica NO2]